MKMATLPVVFLSILSLSLASYVPKKSFVSTQKGRSGFDDIGFTRDFGRDGTISGIRSGVRGRGSVSGNFGSFDGGMGHGKGDGSVIGIKKGSGGRISSVVDTFGLQRESGFGGISGTSESLLRKLNGDTSVRGRSFIGTSAGGMKSANCQYECGKNKRCPLGKTCVEDGCHNICKVDISPIDKNIGLLDDMGGSIIRTSQGGEFGTHRSSFQTASRILDGISGRSSGLTGRQTGIIGLPQGGSKKICRQQCDVDGDCPPGKICVINGCHQYCRRGPVKNNYQP